MHNKQHQLEKLLVNRYGFVFKENIDGSVGLRVILSHLYGLEVSISEYRVCFYSSGAASGVLSNPFPAKNSPRCFDIDKKSQIKEYLEKLTAVSSQLI